MIHKRTDSFHKATDIIVTVFQFLIRQITPGIADLIIIIIIAIQLLMLNIEFFPGNMAETCIKQTVTASEFDLPADGTLKDRACIHSENFIGGEVIDFRI